MNLERTPDGWRVRLRHGGAKRSYFTIPADPSETDDARAQAIAASLQKMANRLAAAGRDPDEIREYLEDATGDSGDRVRFSRYEKRTSELPPPTKTAERAPLFRELAAQWLSGDLRRRFPDDVRALKPKTHAKYSSCLVLINRMIGDKPVDAITLEDAEAVKAAIPTERTQSTRRAYALTVRTVLGFAEYPLKLIEKSPIPKRFVPPQGKSPAFGFLYPKEEAQLIRYLVSQRRADPDAFDDAVMYGTLHREGMRMSEAAQLTVSDLDFESGEVTLDENKTDDPRTWALGYDVALALKAYVGDAGPDDLVFPNFIARHAAQKFRAYILAAGITRKELGAGVNRKAIRLHDARASFITVSLANGMTETWVMDRTGHQSSAMVNKYRRQMRHAKTLGLGWFQPLNELLGYVGRATLPRGPRVAHDITMQGNLAGREHVAVNPQFASQGYGPSLEADNRLSGPTPRNPGEPSGPAEIGGVAHGEGRVGHDPRGLANVGPGAPDTAHPPMSAEQDTAAPTADPIAAALAEVEATLGRAIDRATAAGEWETVRILARELEARRLAREAAAAKARGVASLDAARRKKEDR